MCGVGDGAAELAEGFGAVLDAWNGHNDGVHHGCLGGGSRHDAGGGAHGGDNGGGGGDGGGSGGGGGLGVSVVIKILAITVRLQQRLIDVAWKCDC